MKVYFRSIGVVLLCLSLLLGTAALCTGCGEQRDPAPGDNNATVIICTSFAGFDFTRSMLEHYTECGGTGIVELSLLGKQGQDMHSYEPTAKDIIQLAGADIVVCTGAESWLDAALSSAGNKDVLRVSMMEVCDADAIEHDHDHSHGEGDCALIGQDEHVWLSPGNAARITRGIADALMSADRENAAAWQECAALYTAELTELKNAYGEMMAQATRDTVVVADRYPFAYLFSELGLHCVAAFPGCSSETSASFETQMKLIETVKEKDLPYIFIMEGSDGKVAATVADETGAKILTLDSMQVVTDMESRYTDVMRKNLENLKKALQ